MKKLAKKTATLDKLEVSKLSLEQAKVIKGGSSDGVVVDIISL